MLLVTPVLRLPLVPDDCANLFDDALRALALCSDAVLACGSVTARVYAAGAAGALRHALMALANEGRMRPWADPSTFDVSRFGEGELVGIGGRWDTLRGCAVPAGGSATVHALWPVDRVGEGVWLRTDDEMPALVVRGRVADDGRGSPVFHDEPDADRPAAPRVVHDLGRDLVCSASCEVSRTPALAVALELALACGSWLHVASGTRWFVDPAGARTIVRMLGSPVTIADEGRRRLGGFVDREALVLIERLGWRQAPTPTVT